MHHLSGLAYLVLKEFILNFILFLSEHVLFQAVLEPLDDLHYSHFKHKYVKHHKKYNVKELSDVIDDGRGVFRKRRYLCDGEKYRFEDNQQAVQIQLNFEGTYKVIVFSYDVKAYEIYCALNKITGNVQSKGMYLVTLWFLCNGSH